MHAVVLYMALYFFTLKSALKYSYVTYSDKCLKIVPSLLESVLGM